MNVQGTWTATGTAVSCTTGADGTCSVSSGVVPRSTDPLTFRVDGLLHETLAYEPGQNTDPDGDSDGTTITVARGG